MHEHQLLSQRHSWQSSIHKNPSWSDWKVGHCKGINFITLFRKHDSWISKGEREEAPFKGKEASLEHKTSLKGCPKSSLLQLTESTISPDEQMASHQGQCRITLSANIENERTWECSMKLSDGEKIQSGQCKAWSSKSLQVMAQKKPWKSSYKGTYISGDWLRQASRMKALKVNKGVNFLAEVMGRAKNKLMDNNLSQKPACIGTKTFNNWPGKKESKQERKRKLKPCRKHSSCSYSRETKSTR